MTGLRTSGPEAGCKRILGGIGATAARRNQTALVRAELAQVAPVKPLAMSVPDEVP